MNISKWYAAITLGLTVATLPAFGKVSAEEANKLKTSLTPMGAEKAGNAEGTIPAWDGGYTKVDPNWKPGTPRPDPFASEKPLFSINAANLAKYADKLTEGQKAMFQKYPDWRLDVYPTHRTAAAPQYVYDNTFKNATGTELAANGLSFKNAYAGTPFPIPKSGIEAIWNHLTSWRGECLEYTFQTVVADSSGHLILATEAKNTNQWPYYDHTGSLSKFGGDFFWLSQYQTAPPTKAGEQILIRDSVDGSRKAWQYLSGQRRTRLAPTIGYDTPNFVASGVGNFDEIFVYLGSPDRYSWKLVGKKEIYIPYNQNRLEAESRKEIAMKPKFLNPDLVRWELHRVWVVEATLASGQRHVMPKRRFYLDEDTWTAVLNENYDAQNHLWKYNQIAAFFLAPDLPGVISQSTAEWDLINNNYYYYGLHTKPVTSCKNKPATYYTPEAMAGAAIK